MSNREGKRVKGFGRMKFHLLRRRLNKWDKVWCEGVIAGVWFVGFKMPLRYARRDVNRELDV